MIIKAPVTIQLSHLGGSSRGSMIVITDKTSDTSIGRFTLSAEQLGILIHGLPAEAEGELFPAGAELWGRFRREIKYITWPVRRNADLQVEYDRAEGAHPGWTIRFRDRQFNSHSWQDGQYQMALTRWVPVEAEEER